MVTKKRRGRILIVVLGLCGLILTWCPLHVLDFRVAIAQLILVVLIVMAAFWSWGLKRIPVVVTVSYFLVVLMNGIYISLHLDEAQIPFQWIEVLNLIWPFFSLHLFLVHYLQELAKTDSMLINFVLAPSASFILIGCPYFYLLGNSLNLIWGIGRLALIDQKSSNRNISENDASSPRFFLHPKSLFASSVLSFLFLIYLLITFSQWNALNFKNNIYLANYAATKDFQENRLKILKLGPGKTPHFSGEKIGNFEVWIEPWRDWRGAISLPHYIDKKNYVQIYNNAVFRLTRMSTVKKD